MIKPIIFLSYSSADKATAIKVTKILKDNNIDVWIDLEQIRASDSIPPKISMGLSKCDAIVLLVSKNYIDSSWCKTEYEALLVDEIQRGVTRIIPVLIEKVELPPLLAAKRYLNSSYGLKYVVKTLCSAILDAAGQKNFLSLTNDSGNAYLWGENSVIDLIVSKLLGESSIEKIKNIPLARGYSYVDLYRAVDRLIDSYIKMMDEAMRIFAKDYYRFDKAEVQELAIANRKLLAIARDMRTLSTEFESIIERTDKSAGRLITIAQLCTNITVLDMGGVQLLFGTPKNIPEDEEIGMYGTLGIEEAPGMSLRDRDFSDFKRRLDWKKVDACLLALERIRAKLRAEIGKLAE